MTDTCDCEQNVLHPQVPLFEGRDGPMIAVDEGIAPLLRALWSRGWLTEFSCQGVPKCPPDVHPETWCSHEVMAYVAFPDPGHAREFFDLVWNDLPELDCELERWQNAGVVRFLSPDMPIVTAKVQAI